MFIWPIFAPMTEKQTILTSSEKLFMRYGLKSVSMDDIARDLGMSKKTIYQFVQNKEVLIKEIVVARIEREMKIIEGIFEKGQSALEEILSIARFITKDLRDMSPKVLFDMQKYYRDIFQMIESFHNEFIYKTIKDNLVRGIEEGLYRKDINAEVIARLYVGKTVMLVDESAFSLREYHPDELFIQHIRYHIHGVASPKGIKLLEKYTKANEK